MAPRGFEPLTSGLKGQRSNRAELWGHKKLTKNYFKNYLFFKQNYFLCNLFTKSSYLPKLVFQYALPFNSDLSNILLN